MSRFIFGKPIRLPLVGICLYLYLTVWACPAATAWWDDSKPLVIESITPSSIRLDEQLCIKLNSLPDKTKAEWVLYLNRVPITSLKAETISTVEQKIYFRLDRVILKPYMERLIAGLKPEVALDVALGTDKEMLTVAGANLVSPKLAIFSPERAVGFVVFAVALLVALIVMTRRSRLLRVRGPGGVAGPYSLALTQMAFWFVLTVVGYLYIGIVTGDYSAISPSMLILLGISATTGVAAVTIDDDKLRRQVANATFGATARELFRSPRQPVEFNRKYFILDLISDDGGVSLHRFQIFIWTIVLGSVFIAEVINKLTMPEFNSTLLTLMGISSGTYLAFKFPENKEFRPAEPVDTPAPTNPAPTNPAIPNTNQDPQAPNN